MYKPTYKPPKEHPWRTNFALRGTPKVIEYSEIISEAQKSILITLQNGMIIRIPKSVIKSMNTEYNNILVYSWWYGKHFVKYI